MSTENKPNKYCDINEYVDRGEFKFIETPGGDFSDGIPYAKSCIAFSKLENPPIFIQSYGRYYNVACTHPERMWVCYDGNIGGTFSIPLKRFNNDDFKINAFPCLASFAIRDIANKYAPDCYFSKFPNDVVCKEHGSKTSGILIRKDGDYVSAIFGFNLVQAPKNDLLRTEGLTACCMKNHTSNIPKRGDFICEACERTLELLNQVDTPEKFAELSNKGFNAMGPKLWKLVINNKDANIATDGWLWCSSHPNALFKGYLNGKPYDMRPYSYDNNVYTAQTNHPLYIDVKKKAEAEHFEVDK